MPQDLEGTYSHAVGKVQAPGLVHHGNAHRMLRVGKEERFRQSGGFLSEKQVAILRIDNIGVTMLSLRGKEEKISGRWCGMFRLKIVQTIVKGDLQILPVVQSGMSKFFVIQLEAHGPDEMKGSSDHGAGSSDVSGVLGDFRFNQYDVKRCHVLTFQKGFWNAFVFVCA